MKKEEIIVYDRELGIEGTIPQLVDWAYRYDSDYSDEALEKISANAEALGFSEKYVRVPLLVRDARKRENTEDGSLPYESMKLDKLTGGRIGYEETKEYGEVEIREENDKVLIAVTGSDSEGFFTAASAVSADEFMNGEPDFLEKTVSEILFYGKTYEDDEE